MAEPLPSDDDECFRELFPEDSRLVVSPVESPLQQQMVPADTEDEGAVQCRQMPMHMRQA